MQCPNCRLENPPSAEWCDCGYSFKTRSVERTAAVNGSSADPIKKVPSESQIVKALLTLFTFGALLWLGKIILFPAVENKPAEQDHPAAAASNVPKFQSGRETRLILDKSCCIVAPSEYDFIEFWRMVQEGDHQAVRQILSSGKMWKEEPGSRITLLREGEFGHDSIKVEFMDGKTGWISPKMIQGSVY